MGLFDFVKDAGEDLLEKVKGVMGPSTDAIKTQIQKHGLKVDDLKLGIDGDKATVGGRAASHDDKEKTVLVVGNTKGIAKVDDQLEVASTFYTVKSGDTLSKIAKEVYGDPQKYPVIFEANKPMLTDPDKIYPGQNLRIPPIAE